MHSRRNADLSVCDRLLAILTLASCITLGKILNVIKLPLSCLPKRQNSGDDASESDNNMYLAEML